MKDVDRPLDRIKSCYQESVSPITTLFILTCPPFLIFDTIYSNYYYYMTIIVTLKVSIVESIETLIKYELLPLT